MAEPTVQVPVSLIERAEAAKSDADAWRVVGDLLLCVPETAAALSQPTPSAEPKQLNPDAMQRALDYHGWPPRIAEMAPGTTFTAEVRFLVDVHGTPLAHSGFNPSTIRDVTVPGVGG